jgi:hypothetical protein
MATHRQAAAEAPDNAEASLMSASGSAPRRIAVERNIYKRPTGVLEVGFRDATGKQRWRKVEGGILAARRLRDELLVRKSSGEAVTADPRLRFGDAADRWLSGPVGELRESTQAGYRNAVEQHLPALRPMPA